MLSNASKVSPKDNSKSDFIKGSIGHWANKQKKEYETL